MSRQASLFPETGEETFRRARRGDDADLDITPMIDVTFLLLIFFMVTSTMQATAETDIPKARHGVGIDANRSTIVGVRLPDGAEGEPEIALGDGGPRAEIDEVADYVREGLEADRSRVIIKADRDVPHGFVQRVARAINTVEGVRFFIGVRDERAR